MPVPLASYLDFLMACNLTLAIRMTAKKGSLQSVEICFCLFCNLFVIHLESPQSVQGCSTLTTRDLNNNKVLLLNNIFLKWHFSCFFPFALLLPLINYLTRLFHFYFLPLIPIYNLHSIFFCLTFLKLLVSRFKLMTRGQELLVER